MKTVSSIHHLRRTSAGLFAVFLTVCLFAGCGKKVPAENALAEGKAAYDRKDYATAVRCFAPAADQGDAEAQYMLGLCREYGHGIRLDWEKAAGLFRKAADQGHTGAQYMLGKCHEFGWGVKKDMKEAVQWYGKAADQGDAEAQFMLGECCYYAWGVERDYAKAVQWYAKAADQEATKSVTSSYCSALY